LPKIQDDSGYGHNGELLLEYPSSRLLLTPLNAPKNYTSKAFQNSLTLYNNRSGTDLNFYKINLNFNPTFINNGSICLWYKKNNKSDAITILDLFNENNIKG
jgi:hypothetical protein